MKVNRLSKDEITEGLTLDLVNSMDMDRCFSPVQLLKDDEPVKLLKCLKGYNVLFDGDKVLKDSNNKAIVLKERECQVGRARYLLKYSDKEKDEKTIELIESWRLSVREHLDRVKLKINSLESSLFESIVQAVDKEGFSQYKEDRAKKVAELKPLYEKAEAMFAENRFPELLNAFGIAKLENPMLTVRHDDEKAMRVLKNVFGAKACDNWDGDSLSRYARIEVEKLYASIPL
jgi:hypothetical protein